MKGKLSCLIIDRLVDSGMANGTRKYTTHRILKTRTLKPAGLEDELVKDEW